MKIQLLFLTLMLSIAGCGNAASQDEGAAAQSTEKNPKQDNPAANNSKNHGVKEFRAKEEKVEIHEDRDSQLAIFVFDGSSEAAFETGLKEFQAAAPVEEYRDLKSAIQYLLFYDLSARGNKAKLYSSLNGKTAKQIIDGAGR